MQTEVMSYGGCCPHDMVTTSGKFYYKVPTCFYIGTNNECSMYNAVNAETGELGWIDTERNVEVICHAKS